MPELSRFFGIVVSIFYKEHGRPHYHATYAEFRVVIDIETGDIMAGELPRRALDLILEWHDRYRLELIENWELARHGRELKKIPALE